MKNLEDYRKIPVKKVITKDFLSVQSSTDVNVFLNKFQKLENKEQPIVVFDKKKFIGFIEPINLVKLLTNRKNLSNKQILSLRGVDFAFFPKTVADLATRRPLTVNSKTTVQRAATIMFKRSTMKLAVTDSGKFVGVVTAASLFTNITRI